MSGERTPERPDRSIFARWWPAVVCMAAIFVASHNPAPPGAAGWINDKLAHAAVYGVLALAYLRALTGSMRGPFATRALLAAVALAGSYGVTDEFHQAFIPSRQPDALDLAADLAGAAMAVAAARWWSGGQGV